jgi:hypothetical protein
MVVPRDGGTDIDLLSGLDGRDRFDGGEAGGTLLGGAIDPGDVDANTVRARISSLSGRRRFTAKRVSLAT